MRNTQEFIYKGYSDAKTYESSFYRLGKQGDKTPYYILNLDTELEIGQKLQVHYNHTAPYRKGKLLVGGACNE